MSVGLTMSTPLDRENRLRIAQRGTYRWGVCCERGTCAIATVAHTNMAATGMAGKCMMESVHVQIEEHNTGFGEKGGRLLIIR